MNLELYIDNTRVDLFKDEAITLTDTQQNIRDIALVFTPFSQQFNLPASSTNNKIFKHYYNNDIVNGYDARFRVDAIIKLDGADFKVGKIRLDSVSMKDNKAHAYKVVFFGNTSSLKDIFGDETLSALNPLNAYDMLLNNNDILNAFTDGLQSSGQKATNVANRNVTLPLISLVNAYYYDSTSTSSTNDNLYNVGFASGVIPLNKQLKPAIKCKRIIEAIETQYNIDFSTEFFSSELFDELYLWLHREKVKPPQAVSATPSVGSFGIDFATRSKKLTFADFTYVGGSGDVLTNNKLVVNKGESYSLRLVLDPSITNNTGEIIVRDKITNELLFYRENVPFDSSSNLSVPLLDLTSGNLDQRTYDIEFRINCQVGVTFAPLLFSLVITKDATTIHNYGILSSYSLGQNLFIQDYIPNMKVLDFITTLFKMFNLTAYTKRGESKIYVQTFDDFMSAGNTHDISKYIVIDKNTIDRPIPYSRINFNYSPSVTQTSLRYLNQFSQQFGNLNYSAPDKYDGQGYDVQVDGQRSVLVNIIDENDDTTGLVYGAWLDFDNEMALGSPYMFFNQLVDSSAYPVTSSQYDTYNAPSNNVRLNSLGISSHSLNFGAEFNAYTGNVNENSLFSRFYSQYIVKLFEEQARVVKFTAQLPSSIVLNYELNDVFIVNGQEYFINSIRINLLTNKSELELITKQSDYTPSVLTV
jgi:hypothetical protein